ncbi:hypothetical protein [Variovorax paradoxus]|uniref:Uncharacterized protein n=1 Tax=Variovorax paradoxus TaxID=34073 RepID=A0A6I6HMA4_VARPD|nr:hypothetical protein [Variovorax paradoxus]QGW84019.1 hypothetical protein GOQ09_21655 [Variovorax paradoxus]
MSTAITISSPIRAAVSVLCQFRLRKTEDAELFIVWVRKPATSAVAHFLLATKILAVPELLQELLHVPNRFTWRKHN